MITFKQYLREEERDLVKFLRDNCDQAVHEMFRADKFLWRGANKSPNEQFKYGDETFDGFIGVPREDRTPRDTPEWAHKVFDEYFKKEFGQPLRSNSVFALAHRMYGYGSVFALLPIGPYKIYWSRSVQDLTTTVFPYSNITPKDEQLAGGDYHWQNRNIKSGDVTKEMQIDYINSFLDHANYIDDDNTRALKSGSELMVRCKSYLALDISTQNLRRVIQDAAIDERIEQ